MRVAARSPSLAVNGENSRAKLQNVRGDSSGESPAAFERRCIPKLPTLSHFLQGSKTAGMLPRRALRWPDAALLPTTLGATRDFHHGSLVPA